MLAPMLTAPNHKETSLHLQYVSSFRLIIGAGVKGSIHVPLKRKLLTALRARVPLLLLKHLFRAVK